MLVANTPKLNSFGIAIDDKTTIHQKEIFPGWTTYTRHQSRPVALIVRGTNSTDVREIVDPRKK